MFVEPLFRESARAGAQSLFQPSDVVRWHFRQGRIAKANQQWRLEKMAYLLGANEQQIIRAYGKPPLEPKPKSVVYLIGSTPRPADGEPVKIGYTTSVPRRLDSIRAGSVRELMLVAYLEGGKTLEAELHDELRFCQIREDWFEMCDAVRDSFRWRIEQQARAKVEAA